MPVRGETQCIEGKPLGYEKDKTMCWNSVLRSATVEQMRSFSYA